MTTNATEPISVHALDPDIATRLNTLCVEVCELREARKAIETEEKELKAEIKALAVENELETVDGDGWKLLHTYSGKSDIKAELLLEKGVKMSVIQAATVKREWDYYQVRPAKA